METPSWYWTKGLHDAKIIDWYMEKFDYDYSKPHPIRNCLIIKLDARNALFDTTIKAIKFMNAKILQENANCINWFWKEDVIKKTHRGYEMEITLISYPNIKKINISFEGVIVERN